MRDPYQIYPKGQVLGVEVGRQGREEVCGRYAATSTV